MKEQRQINHFTRLYYGNKDMIKLIIEAGVDINQRSFINRTPLHCATYDGYTEIVELLIRAGADLNVIDRYGDTPLSDAIRRRHYDIVNLLERQELLHDHYF